MGVMTRERGEIFVITSDRSAGDSKSKRAPKYLSDLYLVWTGEVWSSDMAEAKTFNTAEAADDYIRANSGKVMQDS